MKKRPKNNKTKQKQTKTIKTYIKTTKIRQFIHYYVIVRFWKTYTKRSGHPGFYNFSTHTHNSATAVQLAPQPVEIETMAQCQQIADILVLTCE